MLAPTKPIKKIFSKKKLFPTPKFASAFAEILQETTWVVVGVSATHDKLMAQSL